MAIFIPVKSFLLYLGLLTEVPLLGYAQALSSAPPVPVIARFAADFQPVDLSDTTAYCAETTFRDSLSAVTRVYYPSGYLKQYIPYANVHRRILHGVLSTWYEDGRMHTKEEYVNGQRNGDLLTYYPDGTPRRRDRYVAGRCGVGSCYAPNGQPVPYFGYEQMPLYPGGEEELAKELAQGVRLNSQEAKDMRREGHRTQTLVQRNWRREVDVELAVATDGRITNARVVGSSADFLNSAVLRAVAKLQRQFVPGRRDGQVMNSYFTVPVYYTLEMPYRPPYNASRMPRRW